MNTHIAYVASHFPILTMAQAETLVSFEIKGRGASLLVSTLEVDRLL